MASRAPSRLSTSAYDAQSRQDRRARPSSALSYTSTVDNNTGTAVPYTPSGRRSHLARDSRQSLGLSTIQVDKLSETIASVQRGVRNIDVAPTLSSTSSKGKEREALRASESSAQYAHGTETYSLQLHQLTMSDRSVQTD